MSDPKSYVGCASTGSVGMSRTIAEDRARHEAIKETSPEIQAGTISGRVVGYMDEELAATCEKDPDSESCTYYQEFKSLLGEDKMPRKGQVCALFKPSTMSCGDKETNSASESMNNKGAELDPPKSKEEMKARATSVFDEVKDKLAGLDEEQQNSAFDLIITRVKEGYPVSRIVEMVNAGY